MQKHIRNVSIQLSVVLMLCLAGCAGEPLQPPTWEEFRAQVYQVPDTGIFIVNGDEPVLNEDELRQFYDQMIAAFESEQEGLGSTQQPLIQQYVPMPGFFFQWGIPAARNLTYCISSASFGADYAAVVSAMNTAAVDWENTKANINFVHVSSKDSNCDDSSEVVFNVRKDELEDAVALAFYPGDSRSSRQLRIDPSAFSAAPWTLAGIMRHELGHVLSFRHEHIHVPQTNLDCIEPTNYTRALTPYDSNSVMHYGPLCHGTNSGDLVLSESDKAGVRLIYPVALLGEGSLPEEKRRLLAGQSISSSDGRFKLTLQSGGNLVHTWNDVVVLWSSGTGNTNAQSAWMQEDGNFVLYSTTAPSAGNHLWASNTGGNGNSGAYLAIQNDGNLVVYDHSGATALWNSNTGGH